ncbi:MAG TPA: integration host factor subunit alpha [Bdellovibrionota bacterium]|jgi:integration host factor subunit alpha|nr:integration host factor subunit alpha [Bdellovibrionota bacterium]
MTLTKVDIVEKTAETCGFSKLEAADLVEAVFEAIKAALENGENVKISGFGNFVLRDKRSRVGRNPQTGKAMEISARRVMSFKVSQVLKEAINSGTLSAALASREED